MAGTVIIETNLITPEIAMYLSFMYLYGRHIFSNNSLYCVQRNKI
jgi:hypothetical protein